MFKKILSFMLFSFLLFGAAGCGDDGDDNIFQGGPFPVDTGSFQVLLSEADLVDILPLPLPQTASDILDDNGVDMWGVVVFDINGQIAASTSFDRVPGEGIDVVVEGLLPGEYDVVVDALDFDGDIIASAEAVGVFAQSGNTLLLDDFDFDPIVNFRAVNKVAVSK